MSFPHMGYQYSSTSPNFVGIMRSLLDRVDARMKARSETEAHARSREGQAKAGQEATATTFDIPGSTGNVRVLPPNPRGQQWGRHQGSPSRNDRSPGQKPEWSGNMRPSPSTPGQQQRRRAGAPADEGRHMPDAQGRHAEAQGRHMGQPKNESNVGRRERPNGRHMKP